MSKIYKMRKFLKEFSNKKMLYDRKFQRKYGAWDIETKRRLICSLNKGWVLTNIVAAEIEACMEYATDRGEQYQHTRDRCTDSLEKFGEVRKDRNVIYKYISLDGQHRTRTFLEFFTSGFGVSGKFIDADGKEVEVDNQYFKDMPVRLQDQLYDAPISVAIMEDALYSDLAPIFVGLQDGDPLRAHEKRQAKHTPAAGWIKDRADDMEAAMARIFKEEMMVRAHGDETIAKMTMELIQQYKNSDISTNWDFDSTSIDRWYDIGLGHNSFSDDSCDYIDAAFERSKKILSRFDGALRAGKVPSKFVAKKMIWPLLWACEYAQDNSMYATDMSKLFETVFMVDQELYKNSKIKYSKDEVAAENKAEAFQPKKIQYYWYCCGVPHQVSQRNRNKAKFLDEFTKSVNIRFSTLRQKAVSIAA